MISKEHDPAMTYENLARAVFKCGRFGGPGKCAESSVYENQFVPVASETGKSIMKAIVDQIMSDGNYSEEENNIILDKRNRLSNTTKQEEIIEVIEELIDFLNDQGY